MSPSQRATLGEEAPNPPERSLSYSASSALSIPRSSPPREKPIPSPSPFPVPPLLPSASPPNTRRQRRRRSFSSIAIALHLLTHLTAFWCLEAGKGSSQQGKQRGENIRHEFAKPLVQRQPESILVQQQQTTTAQHALYPRRSLWRWCDGRKRQSRQSLQLHVIQRPLL